VAQEKNNARAARELAWSHYSRGEILMQVGDYAGALQNYRQALAMVKPMAEHDPENVMLQVDLGGNTVNVGKALVTMGRVNEGLPRIEEGIRLLEPQLKADPSNAPAAASASYVWKADALLKTGRAADAVASNRKAISILETADQDGAPDQSQLSRMAATYVKLGTALATAGTTQEAESAYRKALELVAPAKEGDAPSPRVSYVLADAYFGLGELSRKAAERSRANPGEQLRLWSQARDWYYKSEAAWQRISNPALVNPEGFQCGSPSRAAAAREAAEAALQVRK
jgi:tetratricopeptide (TPR) repeat protein